MEHFKEQLNPIRDEEEDTEEEEKLEQERRFINKRGKNEEETPSKEEIERVIKRMKNNKVPGEDGIIVELISKAGSEMRETIYKVIKQIWEEEEVPNKWRVGILHPLHKKGNKAECSNYRYIMLLINGYKILTSIIHDRIKNYTEDIIGEYQCGFRVNRSTIGQLFVMLQIIEKHYEY